MRSIRYSLLLVSVPYAICAGQDPAQVLQQVIAKVRARDAAMPNYTCVQTVERDYYQPRGSTLPRSCSTLLQLRDHRPFDLVLGWTMTDRLRLDVTMSERGEIYSWVGASHFEDTGIDQLVRSGPIGTGSFAGFVSVIFRKDSPSFHFEKEAVANGRNFMMYSFQVPREKSSYRVKAGDSWIRTSYSGTIEVDPETKELVRLTVDSGELPPAAESCATRTDMEFGLERIGEGEFLLPKQGKQRFVAINGQEAENTTTFANCREYRGESSVTFSPAPEPSGAESKNARPVKPIQLSAGLPFTFELTESIATDRAAAGRHLCRQAGKRPGRCAGTFPADGRSCCAWRSAGRRPGGAVLVLRLRTVDVKGVKVPLEAVRDWARMPRTKGGKQRILLPQPWEQNAGVFFIEAGPTRPWSQDSGRSG